MQQPVLENVDVEFGIGAMRVARAGDCVKKVKDDLVSDF
jgi:hypothetical protein